MQPFCKYISHQVVHAQIEISSLKSSLTYRTVKIRGADVFIEMMVDENPESIVNIPIPHYPPFKLRSSLVDKDPVIWVHLLEGYIRLSQFLLQADSHHQKLSVKSKQQLVLFLKVYLSETAEEKNQIFSLGAINPDIKRNTSTLRNYIFQVIRSYSFAKLSLGGDSVWNFIRIYVRENGMIVRGLVDGTYKSKLNDNKKSGNISFIAPVQKHIESLVNSGKFSRDDLECLAYLLGQHANVAKSTTFNISNGTHSGSVKKTVNKASSGSLSFAEKFVSTEWIELLEVLYAGGASVNAETIKDVMIISLIGLTAAKLANLVTNLHVSNVDTLRIYPLLALILTSKQLEEIMPSLKEKLPFLNNIKVSDKYDSEDSSFGKVHIEKKEIEDLNELMPQLSRGQCVTLLKQYNKDIERISNMLFENPDVLNFIEESEVDDVDKPEGAVKSKPTENPSNASIDSRRNVYDGDEISNLKFNKHTVILGKKNKANHKPTSNDLKKKVMTAALRLMYESDEDEPDDTYDDQEKTSGSAIPEENSARKSFKIKVDELGNDDDTENDAPNTTDSLSKNAAGSLSSHVSPVDAIENYLFAIYKRKSDALFKKESRKTKERTNMKNDTGWTDEQIEGWLRMLLRSPRHFKILEENFFYGGNPNRKEPSTGVRKGKLGSSATPSSTEQKSSESSSSDGSKVPPTTKEPNKVTGKDQKKRQYARSEKNKASKANHNRKAQHSKKLNRL
ncbi:Piso0_005221 [Millerozyma farinosa CBS 7064]|uniref:Piso0_005221 protein n=1 Tax=Pichia sorbitophila (strain ATCC MYA-4447 / BCRC 22081 / CBS 7064 / NBRC 10061 / NRRL Y-12695) TaxID=559304 RepID=G8Y4I9_PICSO|nr:Piso0_005221 [Millerozyma farinosa CBS 7064]